MLPAILICAFMIKNAATQTVSTSLGITKSCVLIGDDVKLLCKVSSGCCSSQFRIWEKGSAISLLTDGSSTDASKYVEDYDNGSTGYNLIIKNVQKSDLGLNYKCVYGVHSSELFLDGILCDCLKCAGKNYGWSLLGTVVIGTVMIIAYVQSKLTGKLKTVIVAVLTFIISVVVNALIALLIGYFVCHCVDGTDPAFIAAGLVITVIIGLIVLKIAIKQGDGDESDKDVDKLLQCCCSILLALCLWLCCKSTGSSQGSNGSSCWPPSKVEQEPKNPKKPSSNEPLKENKKKKPAAEKSSNEQSLEEKKKKKSAAGKGSRSPTSATKHIKTANNETEMIPTEKGFSGDLEKKRPLPPLTNQPSPTNRPLPLPSSTKPLPSSTRPLPQITTKKGDN